MSTTQPVADLPLFADLDCPQRAAVAALTREVTFSAGERLFEEGRPAAGCWVIRRGQVALDTSVPGRAPLVVQTLGPGDIVGWSWLVPPFQWQFGAVAVTEVAAVALDTVGLRVLADRDPALGYRLTLPIIQALLDRLQASRARLLDLYGNPHAR